MELARTFKNRSQCVAVLLFSAFTFLSADPAPGAAPGDSIAGILDQRKIHNEYNEGDFDAVIAALERFKQRHKTFARGDSVFVAKHLAVVYTANPDTREKGKYYMNQLLELLPSAKLVDMYVSDEIDHIFDKVREEFISRQQGFGVDSSQIKMPDRAPATASPNVAPPPPPSSPAQERADSKLASRLLRNPWTWAIGGGTALLGGVIIYLAESGGSEPELRQEDWDVTVKVPQQ
jgi:hypothetical protein